MRLIDADAFIDFIDAGHLRSPIQLCFSELDVVNMIKSRPTVEAVPVVHGRWIPIEYDGYADGYPVWDLWECSECREEHSGDEDTLTPYCPNCGARMDGDADG